MVSVHVSGRSQLDVVGAAVRCGSPAGTALPDWGWRQSTVRPLPPAPGSLVPAPGRPRRVRAVPGAGPRGSGSRPSCGAGCTRATARGAQGARRGRLCVVGQGTGQDADTGRLWLWLLGLPSLFWLWTEELSTKGSCARQVVAGQQQAVSGQEGWSQQEKLAESPHFYDVIRYVRILSSENCLAVEKDPIRNLFLKLFRLSKEYF